MLKVNRQVFQVTFDATESTHTDWMSVYRVFARQPQTSYVDIKDAFHVFSLLGYSL